jgi:SRSO17 transposase
MRWLRVGRAKWDAGRVREVVREYVLEHVYDEAAVLAVDETGDVKKGMHALGAQRQYTCTAGRIETPRSPSTSSTQSAADARRWTVSCTSRARGHATWPAARLRA